MGQYDKVLFDGKQLTRRQRQALKHVQQITLERYGLALHLYQGSWRPRTSYSGTSHTGAGVVDVFVFGMSTNQTRNNEITRLLRREGHQAAFQRGPEDDMPYHWHVLDLDTHGMDRHDGYGGVWQVGEYYARNNGLSAGVKDRYPYRPRPITEWDYRKKGQ